MAELPADLAGPSNPALVWALADQEWAWRYPPLKVSMSLDGIRIEADAENLLTLEQHRELAEAIRGAVADLCRRDNGRGPGAGSGTASA
jgi:phage terminase large subunit-like protein